MSNSHSSSPKAKEVKKPSSDQLQGVYRITNQFFLLPQRRMIEDEESAAVRVSQVQGEQSCGNLSLLFGCQNNKLEIRGQCQEKNDKGKHLE